MIIGNSYAGPSVGRAGAPGASGPSSAKEKDGADNAPSFAPSSTSFGPEREAAMSMHQTARIVAQVASMSRMDDMSAYAALSKEDGGSDQYRQVVSAYQQF